MMFWLREMWAWVRGWWRRRRGVASAPLLRPVAITTKIAPRGWAAERRAMRRARWLRQSHWKPYSWRQLSRRWVRA